MSAYPSPLAMRETTLCDVLDSALDKGVVLQGDATISVADIDLVFLGLKLVLASVETMESWRKSALSDPGNVYPEPFGFAQGKHSRRGGNCQASSVRHGVIGSALERKMEQYPPTPARYEPADPTDKAQQSPLCGKPRPLPAGPDKVYPEHSRRVEQGLAKLVLTVVELLRRLLEKQALRRMEGGSLTDWEIEQMGITFQRLEQKMEELRRVFGLEGEELNLNLGPLGNLM